MAIAGRTGIIGVYGTKTRALQRRLTRETFGLTFKEANFYMYLGSKSDASPAINKIQDAILFETRDNAYDTNVKIIPISMEEKGEQVADYSQFGYIDPIGNKTIFRLFVDDMVDILGRKIVVGDVFEIPFYNINGQREFWKVSDVDDSQTAEKFITVLTAEPLTDSVEHNDIPIDGDELGSIFTQQEEEFTEQIPADVEVPDGTATIPEQEVDYRDELQDNFLDDINGGF